jgi:hypothetical protein
VGGNWDLLPERAPNFTEQEMGTIAARGNHSDDEEYSPNTCEATTKTPQDGDDDEYRSPTSPLFSPENDSDPDYKPFPTDDEASDTADEISIGNPPSDGLLSTEPHERFCLSPISRPPSPTPTTDYEKSTSDSATSEVVEYPLSDSSSNENQYGGYAQEDPLSEASECQINEYSHLSGEERTTTRSSRNEMEINNRASLQYQDVINQRRDLNDVFE